MRRTLFVASWKANMPNLAEATAFFDQFRVYAANFRHEVVLCPSFVYLETAQKMMPTSVRLGAQDVSQYSNGPFTGEITASMLASFGVKYCVVGHFERRAMGETDELLNKKITQLLANGITPVICIGDTLAEYDANMTRQILERQLTEMLRGVKEWDKLVFAYMPVWSINSGRYASGEFANLVLEFMRQTVQKISGVPMAAHVPMLYGGNVSASNVKEYLEQPHCDGVIWAIGATKPEVLAGMVTAPFTPKSFTK